MPKPTPTPPAPDMTSVNISLPAPLRTFIEEIVRAGGYGSVSEYIRELIRADQKHRARERVEALLLEGLESGEPIEVTPEYWERKKAAIRSRAAKAGRA